MRNSLTPRRLERWNPWNEMTNFQRSFESLLDRLPAFSSAEAALATLAPDCDLLETDAAYLMTFEIPGVSKDDVKIEAFENQIRISGEKKSSRNEKQGSHHLTERMYGRFERQFALPTKVQIDKVEANYRDGVLKLTIPKASGTVSRQVKIAEGSTN